MKEVTDRGKWRKLLQQMQNEKNEMCCNTSNVAKE
jgi:hypothetical protein